MLEERIIVAKRLVFPYKCQRCDGLSYVEYREPEQDRVWTTLRCKNSEKPILQIQNDITHHGRSFRIWDVIRGKYVLGDKRRFESKEAFENWVAAQGGRRVED